MQRPEELEGLQDSDVEAKIQSRPDLFAASRRPRRTFGFDWGTGFSAPFVPTPSPTADFIAAHVAMPEGGLVMDIGCGRGDLLFPILLSHPTSRGLALDLDSDLICQATDRAAALGLSDRCTFLVEDARNFDVLAHRPSLIVLYMLPEFLKWLSGADGPLRACLRGAATEGEGSGALERPPVASGREASCAPTAPGGAYRRAGEGAEEPLRPLASGEAEAGALLLPCSPEAPVVASVRWPIAAFDSDPAIRHTEAIPGPPSGSSPSSNKSLALPALASELGSRLGPAVPFRAGGGAEDPDSGNSAGAGASVGASGAERHDQACAVHFYSYAASLSLSLSLGISDSGLCR